MSPYLKSSGQAAMRKYTELETIQLLAYCLTQGYTFGQLLTECREAEYVAKSSNSIRYLCGDVLYFLKAAGDVYNELSTEERRICAKVYAENCHRFGWRV